MYILCETKVKGSIFGTYTEFNVVAIKYTMTKMSLLVVVQENCSDIMCISGDLNLKFLASSESLSCPICVMSLGKARGHCQLQDDNFVTDKKHPRLLTIKKNKVMFYYYFKRGNSSC